MGRRLARSDAIVRVAIAVVVVSIGLAEGGWTPSIGLAEGGWTPSIGPPLGAMLALAVSASRASAGVLVLLAFAAGLAVPFIAVLIALRHLRRLAGRLGRRCLPGLPFQGTHLAPELSRLGPCADLFVGIRLGGPAGA